MKQMAINLLSAIGFNPFKKKKDEEQPAFTPPKVSIPQINIPQPVANIAKAIASVPQGIASWLKLDQPVEVTKNLPAPIKAAVDPSIRNLRAGMEVINLPSYLLGGAIKAGRETMEGTYQPPETGIKYNITPIRGPQKGQKQTYDVGGLVHPVLLGAIKGIAKKEPLFEEVPKTVGLDPNSLPGMAIGLTAEIAAPGIGGGEKKAAEEVLGKVSKAEELVTALKNALKIKPINISEAADVTKVALPDAMKVIKNLDVDADLLKIFKKGEPLVGDGFTLQAQPKTGELLINIDKSFKDTIPAIADTVVKEGKAALSKIKTKAKPVLDTITQAVEEAPAKAETLIDTATQKAEELAAKVDFNMADLADAPTTTITTTPDQLKDIGNLSKQFKDVYRNFKEVFGPKYQEIKAAILDPFDAAKGAYSDDVINWTNGLRTQIVDNLGIKKGSELSKLTQQYGEKLISLDELKAATPDWQKVVDADSWFRSRYDTLLDEVNAARARIYPDDPTKLIPKRQDYYRHFQEMAEGFKGALNTLETPAAISPELARVSPYTKPLSKFLSFAQIRQGEKTAYDAVGGFIDYIRSAAYAKNIDPTIDMFRGLAKNLVEQTSDKTVPETYGKLNNFINYLEQFSNQLAGKTSTVDRAIQDFVPGGRKTMRLLDWFNSRYKSNTVLGNVSSSLSQILNVPAGVADAGLNHAGEAIFDMAADLFTKDSPIESSNFIKERYLSKAFSQFDEGLLKKPKEFANWMITVLDEAGTKFIWNAQYRKALAEGATDAVKFADDATRAVVAGRGIGEVPLAQQTRFMQLVAPFQVEVGNTWWLMKDWVDAKSFQKFITFFIGTHLANDAIEASTGNRPALDPITAITDALETYNDTSDKTKGVVLAGGRLAGEALSNMPFGQTLASLYPEQGFLGLPPKKEFFGEADPTRFGTGGGLPVLKAVSQPLFYIAPSFGGGQTKKTLGGIADYTKGFAETPKGQVKYPIADTAFNLIKGILFGPYAFNEANDYFDNEASPLGVKDTNTYKQLEAQSPDAATKFYDTIMAGRETKSLLNSLDSKRNDLKLILGDPNKSQSQKDKALQDYYKEVEFVTNKLKEMVPDLPESEIKDLFNPDGQLPPSTTSGATPSLSSGVTLSKIGGMGRAKVKAVGLTKPSVGKVPQLKVTSKKKGSSKQQEPKGIKDLEIKKPYLAQAPKQVKLSSIRNQRVKLPSLA